MQEYKCKLCGAKLTFDPKVGRLRCKYCGSQYNPEDFEDKTVDAKVDNKSELDKQYTQNQHLDDEWAVYACSECGAEVVAAKTTMATTCAYCGSAISITEKTAENFRPQKIIPYRFTKEEAIERYKHYAKQSKYTPDSFVEEATIEKMQNLFVPFYMNSMRVEAEAVLSGVDERSEKLGDDKIVYQDTYHTYVKTYGQISDVPTDASKKIENDLMDAIEPFDYTKMVDFNPSYMAGFIADQPDEYPEDMLKRAESRVASFVDDEVLKENHHGRGSIIGRNYKFMNEESVYAMMPVWIINVLYQGQKYRFAVNGQTGKTVGVLPVDEKKVKKDSFKPCIIISAIAALVGFAAYFLGVFG